jgi:hypothetical protein
MHASQQPRSRERSLRAPYYGIRYACLFLHGGQSRGCIWTLRHPHLIQPYLAHYDHLASHYGGPWCSPIPWWCTKQYLQVPDSPIYRKMQGLPVPNMVTIWSPHTEPPPYDFLNLYGACMQAPGAQKLGTR